MWVPNSNLYIYTYDARSDLNEDDQKDLVYPVGSKRANVHVTAGGAQGEAGLLC